MPDRALARSKLRFVKNGGGELGESSGFSNPNMPPIIFFLMSIFSKT